MVEGNGWKVTVGKASHVQPQLNASRFGSTATKDLCAIQVIVAACEELIGLAQGCAMAILMNHYPS